MKGKDIKRALNEIRTRDMAVPTFKVTGTSDRERRAYRRQVLERLASQQVPPRAPTDLSVAQGARILLQEFEKGDNNLFGFPRDAVDFPRAYELLDEYDTDEMRPHANGTPFVERPARRGGSSTDRVLGADARPGRSPRPLETQLRGGEDRQGPVRGARDAD